MICNIYLNITYIYTYEPINYDGFCSSSSLRFWDPPSVFLLGKNPPTVSRPFLWRGKKPWLLHGLNFRVDAWDHSWVQFDDVNISGVS